MCDGQAAWVCLLVRKPASHNHTDYVRSPPTVGQMSLSTIEEIFNLTRIDRWFLVQIKEIVDFEEELAAAKN